jgi:adenosylhomocysteine nucleosidase
MRFAAIVALPTEMPLELWPFEEPLIYSGVGKINATLATTRVILDYKPDLVLNLGTAGSLNNSIKGLVEVRQVIERDFDAEPLAPRGTVPFDTFPSLMESGFGQMICGTGDTFVRSREKWLEERKVDLVDMELFAIAKTCQHLNTPWRSFKFISDYVNGESGSDWAKNLLLAAPSFLELIKKDIF